MVLARDEPGLAAGRRRMAAAALRIPRGVRHSRPASVTAGARRGLHSPGDTRLPARPAAARARCAGPPEQRAWLPAAARASTAGAGRTAALAPRRRPDEWRRRTDLRSIGR